MVGVEDHPEAVEQADGCLASGGHQDTEPRQALLLPEEKAREETSNGTSCR